jgi:ribosomal protein S17
MAEEKQGHKNEKVGEVVSTKMTKTIVVQVSRTRSISASSRSARGSMRTMNKVRRNWAMWCASSNADR